MIVEEWRRKNPPIQRKPITNADKIRAMTDEELADFMAEFMYCVKCWKFDKEQGICTRTSGCNSAMLDWLKQEAADKDINVLNKEEGET